MKYITPLLLVLLTACASVNYQPYEGKAGAVFEGQGGSKLVVDGIEFWDNGAPPRKFMVLGYATGAIGAGAYADNMIRSGIAKEVKAKGGSAAILVNGNTSFRGIVQAAPGVYTAANTRELKYAVIQYAD